MKGRLKFANKGVDFTPRTKALTREDKRFELHPSRSCQNSLGRDTTAMAEKSQNKGGKRGRRTSRGKHREVLAFQGAGYPGDRLLFPQPVPSFTSSAAWLTANKEARHLPGSIPASWNIESGQARTGAEESCLPLNYSVNSFGRLGNRRRNEETARRSLLAPTSRRYHSFTSN